MKDLENLETILNLLAIIIALSNYPILLAAIALAVWGYLLFVIEE